ncbi:UTRA domain-containing protein [Roseicyclus persicicus]|uniref:GntR family transcriptional regulator n=1 Tax=Roseicyclus persicicus TaxID=2650661 RepID=A0A7X6H0H2_9RHOB|nr:GntR family transcriptional regulator [Roseibacterium persicicum]
MTIHAQPTLPEGGKARRVYLLLREEISNGAFAPGVRLPGEHKLAETFEVSRITIRRALDALAADGWIEKRTGSGSVVLPRDPAERGIAADFATLIPHLVEMDRATTARLLSFSYGPASDAVADALGLPRGGKVQSAVRVRYLGEQPFSHLTTHVPEDIAQGYGEADLATQPLFRLLERSGVTVAGAHQSVTAALAVPDVAAALGVSVGSPLLFVTRVVRDAQGRGVEHLSALYRPDLFRLEMQLTRVGNGEQRHWAPVIGAREP